MAKYRIMKYGQPMPKWNDDKENNFVAAGAVRSKEYTFGIGRLRIALSKEEKESIIETWNKIDKGELKDTNEMETEAHD